MRILDDLHAFLEALASAVEDRFQLCQPGG
jgi:hypothetical protein